MTQIYSEGTYFEVGECPGEVRIPEYRKWFVRKGETAEQATYCKVCVESGCAGIQRDRGSFVILEYANCDCPDQRQHPNYKEANNDFPTKQENRLYKDLRKTKNELENAKYQVEWLQHKLATYYPIGLSEKSEKLEQDFDPKPSAGRSRVYRVDKCGCTHWKESDHPESGSHTSYCRWHLWQE